MYLSKKPIGNDKKRLLRYKRLSEHATAPRQHSKSAAGYDLSAAYNMVISAGTRAAIPTCLKLEFPDGTYGRIAPRSSLSLEGIDISAGVIDPDYEGNIHVVLVNNSKSDYHVTRGARIAQLICEKIEQPHVEEIVEGEENEGKPGDKEKKDDGNHRRGEGAFGSTGHT